MRRAEDLELRGELTGELRVGRLASEGRRERGQRAVGVVERDRDGERVVGQRDRQRLVVVRVDLDREPQRGIVLLDADPQVGLGELGRAVEVVGAHEGCGHLVDAVALVIRVGEQRRVELHDDRVGIEVARRPITGQRLMRRELRDQRSIGVPDRALEHPERGDPGQRVGGAGGRGVRLGQDVAEVVRDPRPDLGRGRGIAAAGDQQDREREERSGEANRRLAHGCQDSPTPMPVTRNPPRSVDCQGLPRHDRQLREPRSRHAPRHPCHVNAWRRLFDSDAVVRQQVAGQRLNHGLGLVPVDHRLRLAQLGLPELVLSG